MMPDTARRHAELIERMERIATGLEALNRTAERQTRLLADVSAKVESALQFFVRAWQHVQAMTEGEQP